MNLYNLHSDPKSLKHHDIHQETAPDLFWDKYRNNPAELKKREQYIAKNPKYAYLYAKDVIKGPWKPGEAAIAPKPVFAYAYARDVIKGPWKPGEAAIAKSPTIIIDGGEVYNYALDYADHVLHGRFPAGEKIIASNPVTAYYYALEVLHGRFPAGEKAIADDEEYDVASEYARDIIKGPWTYDGKTFEP
jgi:hypothetical protein